MNASLSVQVGARRGEADPPLAVYHCFEGEQDCATPSPRDACAEWADGSDECREPLCAFVIN
jgi:hypothetical protein